MKKHCIHVLVATQFKKNPHNLPQVNHKDGVKLNNCDWNLEWCTQLENTNHAWKLGLINNKIQSRPNNKFAAKITESQAKEIKEAKGTNREIALLFGIGYKQVGRIKRGEAWA